MPIITGKQIPDGARDVINALLTTAGLTGCRVTSVARTPREQAKAMYDNCVLTGPAKQLDVYLPAGDEVIAVFEEFYKKQPDLQVQYLMERKILEVGPEKVSHHCLGPDAPIWTIDIAQSSILNIPRFKQSAKWDKRVSKCLDENAVLHVEILKPV